MTANSKYPECDKMLAVKDESHAISAFLDFLQENGYSICELIERNHHNWQPVYKSNEELMAEHFGINLDRVEKERRQMLKEFRNK